MNTTVKQFVDFIMTNTSMDIIKNKGQKNKKEITVSLLHTANPPATENELDMLINRYPNISPAFIDLYKGMNGAKLFSCEGDNIDPSLFFFNINEFQVENDELSLWLEMYLEDIDEWEELQQLDKYLRKSVIVFGGFDSTPERFYLFTEGKYQGNVFLFLHDTCQETLVKMSDTFEDFLELMMNDPYSFFKKSDWVTYYSIFFDD